MSTPEVPAAPHAGAGPHVGSVPARYQAQWGLFADWCAATGRCALPADPVTLAIFLDTLPAAPGTLRRRVAAINTVHRGCGYPAPGTAAAIRARLSRRTRPVPDLRGRATRVIAGLPATGWTAGLFGRRDALILVLAVYAQLPHARIARLRRGDLTLTGRGGLHIAGAGIDRTVDDPGTDPFAGAGAVYARWAHLQAHMDRYPSAALTAQALRAAAPVTADTHTRAEQPPVADPAGALLTRYDRWGSAPLRWAGLSRQAVSTIVTGHLTGTAAPHRAPRPHASRPAADTPPIGTSTAAVVPPLADRYDEAVAAKKHAAAALSGITGRFEEIDDRIDTLLQRTADLLDNYATTPTRDMSCR